MKELERDLFVWQTVGERHIQDVLDIRRQVFVDEQNVTVRNEFDGLDLEAEHYIGYLPDLSSPVVTARVLRDEDEAARIERLAVLPFYRGWGYGSKLMALIHADLFAKEVDLARVEVPLDTNAQGFFEKVGYQAIGGPHESFDGRLRMIHIFHYDDE